MHVSVYDEQQENTSHQFGIMDQSASSAVARRVTEAELRTKTNALAVSRQSSDYFQCIGPQPYLLCVPCSFPAEVMILQRNNKMQKASCCMCKLSLIDKIIYTFTQNMQTNTSCTQVDKFEGKVALMHPNKHERDQSQKSLQTELNELN